MGSSFRIFNNSLAYFFSVHRCSQPHCAPSVIECDFNCVVKRIQILSELIMPTSFSAADRNIRKICCKIGELFNAWVFDAVRGIALVRAVESQRKHSRSGKRVDRRSYRDVNSIADGYIIALFSTFRTPYI